MDAKVHLDFTSGVFDFEGDTDFVKEELRQLRKIIKAGLIPVTTTSVEKTSGQMGDSSITSSIVSEQESNSTYLNNLPKVRKIKQRMSRIPKLIDIDITGKGHPLESFVQIKQPKSDIDKYEVIGYWLKHSLNIIDISNDHIFTCLKAMRWRIPKDIGSGFRNAKMHHGSFEVSQPGVYQLTHLGENRVEFDLPVGKKK